LADAPFEGHLIFVLDVHLRIGPPDFWHPVVGAHNGPVLYSFDNLLTKGAFAGTIPANDDRYLCIAVCH
jgi:hypothetical protein